VLSKKKKSEKKKMNLEFFKLLKTCKKGTKVERIKIEKMNQLGYTTYIY
jgi:hypothetical protein